MNLNDREKNIIISIAICLVIFLAFTIVINPFRAQIKLLDRKISAKKGNLDELDRLKREFNVISRIADNMEQKIARSSKDVTLPSLLENVAKKTNLSGKMTGLRSHETLKNRNFQENEVEISLNDVTLDELMSFIYKLESLPYIIKIKGFKIKTTYGKEPKYIKLTLLVSLFTPN